VTCKSRSQKYTLARVTHYYDIEQLRRGKRIGGVTLALWLIFWIIFPSTGAFIWLFGSDGANNTADRIWNDSCLDRVCVRNVLSIDWTLRLPFPDQDAKRH
jgi:ABC-type Fe3+ transport system permease subunit